MKSRLSLVVVALLCLLQISHAALASNKNLNVNYFKSIGFSKLNDPTGATVTVDQISNQFLKVEPQTAVTFNVPLNVGKPTGGSRYIRTEFSGTVPLNVDSATEFSMSINLAVLEVPKLIPGTKEKSGVAKGLVIGQIKNLNSDPGAPCELYYNSSGGIFLELHHSKSIGGSPIKYFSPFLIPVGQPFTYTMGAKSGKVFLTVNGVSLTPGGAPFPDGWDNKNQRWKAGSYCNYLQDSNTGACIVKWTGFAADVAGGPTDPPAGKPTTPNTQPATQKPPATPKPTKPSDKPTEPPKPTKITEQPTEQPAPEPGNLDPTTFTFECASVSVEYRQRKKGVVAGLEFNSLSNKPITGATFTIVLGSGTTVSSTFGDVEVEGTTGSLSAALKLNSPIKPSRSAKFGLVLDGASPISVRNVKCTTVGSAGANSDSAATTTDNNTSSSSGLSTGAIAGIVVGVVVGVALVVAVVAFVVVRRQQQPSSGSQQKMLY